MSSNLALALQLNHEINAQQRPDAKSLDSATTQSLTDSQVFDSISAGKASLISDKTSKCNLFVGDSPLPSRSGRSESPLPSRSGRADSPRTSLPPHSRSKKDSLCSLRADNISTLSYSVWERGSGLDIELASLSDVSSLCNLICMETGRTGVMSRTHSPAARMMGGARCTSPTPQHNSQTPGAPSDSEEQAKKSSCSVSLRVFALLLDNVNVQRKYLTVRSSSLPHLDHR